MLYYMDSKVFKDKFIPTETAKTILRAQYVIVSTRIRLTSTRSEMNNVITALALYPETEVLSRLTPEDMEDAYYQQLEDNEGLLCSLIRLSIEKNLNIIFLCTKNESKLGYMRWLSEYIYLTYEYPVYSYKDYIKGAPLLKHDDEKVLANCKKRIKKAKKSKREKMLDSRQGRKRIMDQFKSMSKKQLIKECKKRGLYSKTQTKEQMLELLELFPD